MDKEELEKERKQIVLTNALREEIAEIIIRYSKSIDPDMLIGTLFAAAAKVISSHSMTIIHGANLLKKLKE